ncbi:XRE family transcriptional regulator [Brumimicrobium glaciale]|uniref:XRE family transcriptional regulator n=1 Tax=Brumimicrobium glaciale TaxID=200475 RepID=A0A4Q4KFJ9_9FLAO|nr:helix-turn-helix transcriptional regulator [Brumimicrobium glaciale]RYM31297.1 XRE family transcriptional regulator [Brumimicrobium glaciale]
MNTKLANNGNNEIQQEFDKLFAFESEAERIEANAQLLMAKFLSKVQEVTDHKNINRKELAAMIGTSASYLTQLFRGHKNLNFLTLAKLENALDIKFDISLQGEFPETTQDNQQSIESNKDLTNEDRKEHTHISKTKKVSYFIKRTRSMKEK